MKIAHFGTFDVNNYGDLLFPVIARFRWPDIEWIHISPTNRKSYFADALPPINIMEANKIKYDAVIVGGGNIIHTKPSKLVEYHHISKAAYASLWIGAAKLAAKQKIPLLFNAPGIMNMPKSKFQHKLYKIAFEQASYLSFRDIFSSRIASRITHKDIVSVPDTAFDIARIWPKVKSSNSYYIALNLSSRYHTPKDDTVKFIKLLAIKTGFSVRLLIVGACHGDFKYAMEIHDELKDETIVDQSSTLYDLAQTIANSSLFIGSSMHGFITALAYNVPALLLLDKRRPLRKFPGLLKITQLSPNILCQDWESVMDNLNTPALLSEKRILEIKNLLDWHWDQMHDLLSAEDNAENKSSFILMHWKTLLALDNFFTGFLSGATSIPKTNL